MTRTITTAAELDALPVGSVVLDRDGWPMWRTSREGWCASNGVRGIEWPEIERDGVPLTVLHDPSAPVATSATRDEVARLIDPSGWRYFDTGMFPPDHPASTGVVHGSRETADALLARFTITPRTDR